MISHLLYEANGAEMGARIFFIFDTDPPMGLKHNMTLKSANATIDDYVSD